MPLIAASIGLVLPGLAIAKISGFSGAGWIITVAVTLLLPVLAGLTIPYPRSVWNTPVALQLGEITGSLYTYFGYFSNISQGSAVSAMFLSLDIARIVLILWAYVTNSEWATWIMCGYLEIRVGILVVVMAIMYFWSGITFAEPYVLLAAQAILLIVTIQLMLNAHRKIQWL